MRHDREEEVHFHFHFDGNINITIGASDNSEVLDAIHAVHALLEDTSALEAQLDEANADRTAAIVALGAIVDPTP